MIKCGERMTRFVVKSAPIFIDKKFHTLERPSIYILSFENFRKVVLPNELKFSLIDFYIRFDLIYFVLNAIINYLPNLMFLNNF